MPSNKLSSGAISFIEEFKEFALKGNIIDLAVAVVIGAAFGKVITAVVDSFITPLIALILPNVDNLKEASYSVMTIGANGEEVVKASFAWGAFVSEAINFLAVALVLFLVIKKVLGAMQSLRKKEEEAPADPPAEEKLLTEIRDLLANNTKPE